MRRFLWIPVLLLLAGAWHRLAVRAAEPVAAPPAGHFLELLKKGQSVLVTYEAGGYSIKFFEAGQPAPKPPSDVDVRYTTRASEVAQAEYQRALSVNRKSPGVVSEEEVQRLKLAADQRALEVEQARQQVELTKLRLDVKFEVSQVGRDFVALRNASSQLFVPVASIRALVRDVPPGPADAAEK